MIRNRRIAEPERPLREMFGDKPVQGVSITQDTMTGEEREAAVDHMLDRFGGSLHRALEYAIDCATGHPEPEMREAAFRSLRPLMRRVSSVS